MTIFTDVGNVNLFMSVNVLVSKDTCLCNSFSSFVLWNTYLKYDPLFYKRLLCSFTVYWPITNTTTKQGDEL